MQQYDLVLVHPPSVWDFRERPFFAGPVSDMVPSTPIFEMYPLGWATLGDYLERQGLRVRIYNLAAFMLKVKNFDVDKALSKLHPAIFGIDLHWMPHCHGAIELARTLKRLHPTIPIVLGGLSSSVFYEELIAYDCVDFVLRGDSTEVPFEQLVRCVKNGSPASGLVEISNLVWKDSTGAVHISTFDYVPDDYDLVSLNYDYAIKSTIRSGSITGTLPFSNWLKYPVCASLTSKGCERNCPTCGGSAYAFKQHFGRDKVCWRSSQLIAQDIKHIQQRIWGPMFMLNDWLVADKTIAGYSGELIERLNGTLKNPLGIELFGPPEVMSKDYKTSGDFYTKLNAAVPDWSVEISAESHDDAVRGAFGKGHYTMEQLEASIQAAFDNNASRFDLYFMTGIPQQSKQSILDTGEYVAELYQRFNNDKRLKAFISPMAPFLDVGSLAFDNPEKYGYKLSASTLAEHRLLLTKPTWKQTFNYESNCVSADDLVEATYYSALRINQAKTEGGVVSAAEGEQTKQQILGALEMNKRIDEIVANNTISINGAEQTDDTKIELELAKLQLGSEHSISTVANKSELDWPYKVHVSQILRVAGILLKELARNIVFRLVGKLPPAHS